LLSFFFIFSLFLTIMILSSLIETERDCFFASPTILSALAQDEKQSIQTKSSVDKELPHVIDSRLHVEVLIDGLQLPTAMDFLAPNDILVLEKNKGTVQRIVNGHMLDKPLLDVNVNGENERGMAGIAVSKSIPGHTYVFLYYTEAEGQDGGKPIGDRFYRYELVNNKLVNPKLILDIQITTHDYHHGGKILIGPDNNVYLLVGSESSDKSDPLDTMAMNIKDGLQPDGRAGILRFTQDGKPVGEGILGNKYPLNLYYAYGMRNGFGMDFDPVTKKLWDTENGPSFGDEINLVYPGFNSGWKKIQGIWEEIESKMGGIANGDDIDKLMDFAGKGKYSDPEFVWRDPVGVTALTFLNSDKYGKEYQNGMFVGDINFGNLYHFKLNENRTELSLNKPLDDKVVENYNEMKGIRFGEGFGATGQKGFVGITDIEVGRYDGYLYIVSFGQGKIFKIVPNSQ
jgi:aldose sugar dehydrogenase